MRVAAARHAPANGRTIDFMEVSFCSRWDGRGAPCAPDECRRRDPPAQPPQKILSRNISNVNQIMEYFEIV
jgi:hypothetical protein